MGQIAYFAKLPIGVFVCSPEGDLLFYRLFSRKPADALKEFEQTSPSEITQLKGYEILEDRKAYEIFRKNFRDYSVSLGFSESYDDLNLFLSAFHCLISKKRMAGKASRDKLLVESIKALDDLDKAVNLFDTRIYEWFALHYPEHRNTRDLVDKIAYHSRRENFPGFSGSTGVDLNEKDEESIVRFAVMVQTLREERNKLEEYVRSLAKEICPNTSSLVDELLVARLVALAGSLEKLARMPASTIQLIGAEKALFRHLKKRGKPPKYGIIFTSPLIQNAAREKKGKVARILSSKIMMAVRIDYYSGRREPRIAEELEKEIREVK